MFGMSRKPRQVKLSPTRCVAGWQRSVPYTWASTGSVTSPAWHRVLGFLKALLSLPGTSRSRNRGPRCNFKRKGFNSRPQAMPLGGILAWFATGRQVPEATPHFGISACSATRGLSQTCTEWPCMRWWCWWCWWWGVGGVGGVGGGVGRWCWWSGGWVRWWCW